jgi:polyhydroxybutyrate depolymerase
MLGAIASGCGNAAQAPADGGDPDVNSLILQRPYNFQVPIGYDKNRATPLVILLHGYSASGALQDFYFRINEIVDEHNFLFAYPDGLKDPVGNRFWNATDACCDFTNIPVDDVAYINAIIDDVERKYNVDTNRIFVVGHSDGGFMSHRLACDLSPRVAAIVSLAGANWNDITKCKPTAPINVLEVHGDSDVIVYYNGGNFFGHDYPSAMTTATDWATLNGCKGPLADTGETLDLDTLLPGAETSVARFGQCPEHGDVELWTMHGGGHVPAFAAAPAPPVWAETVWSFFAAHPKGGED